MDKKILIEYADMKEEIKDLRRRIAEDKKENRATEQDYCARFCCMWKERQQTIANSENNRLPTKRI
ncbi:MAG: hypothetical protein ACLTUZ_11350 [Sellimonas intestinalis]|uniref:hypothetical protein n=1 Tax=Sellimonas intestinalis TaxID=1653434 RepID=UPI003993EF81